METFEKIIVDGKTIVRINSPKDISTDEIEKEILALEENNISHIKIIDDNNLRIEKLRNYLK